MAEHQAANPQEYCETIEGKRVAAKAKRLQETQQSRPAATLRSYCKRKAIPGPGER